MTLSESFADFLENIRGQSSSSRRLYTQRLSGFLETHGERQAEDIGPADINNWISVLQNRGYAEATMAGYRQAIKAFFNWLVEEEKVTRSPAAHVKTGSFMPRRRKIPNELHVRACADVARGWLGTNEPAKVRDGALWLLARATGARLREIRELKRSDVLAAIDDGPKSGIYLISSTGKTGEVVLRVPEIEMQALEKWLSLRPAGAAIDRVFVTVSKTQTASDPVLRYRPLSRSAATNIFNRLSTAAGLDRPIRCHALRHRLGHMVTKKYGPKVAAMLLNHSDWQTARTAIAFYHHPSDDDVSAAVAEMSSESDKKETDQMAKLFGVHDT